MKIEHRVEMVDGIIIKETYIIYPDACPNPAAILPEYKLTLLPKELLSLKELLANYEIK